MRSRSHASQEGDGDTSPSISSISRWCRSDAAQAIARARFFWRRLGLPKIRSKAAGRERSTCVGLAAPGVRPMGDRGAPLRGSRGAYSGRDRDSTARSPTRHSSRRLSRKRATRRASQLRRPRRAVPRSTYEEAIVEAGNGSRQRKPDACDAAREEHQQSHPHRDQRQRSGLRYVSTAGTTTTVLYPVSGSVHTAGGREVKVSTKQTYPDLRRRSRDRQRKPNSEPKTPIEHRRRRGIAVIRQDDLRTCQIQCAGNRERN